ncbi:MAG: HAD family hydrolase [Methanomethylophilus sp.]|jgi:phosphoglycolate phosphatase
MALDPRITSVGFDMDGTVMHTYVDYMKLGRAIIDVLTSAGVPEEAMAGATHYKLAMNQGLDWMRAHGKGREVQALENRLGAISTQIEMENASMATVFPGVPEMLDLLKSKGYRIGILTRGGRAYATKVLSESGMLKKFDGVVARDDYPEEESKPNPIAIDHLAAAMGADRQGILYVGDREVDYMTAKAAGIPFYGVETGGMTEDIWKTRCSPDVKVLHSAADLADIVRS